MPDLTATVETLRRALDKVQAKLSGIGEAWDNRTCHGSGTAAFLQVESTFGQIREAAECRNIISAALTDTAVQQVAEEIAQYKQIIANHDAALLAAATKAGIPPMDCDTADWLAEEIVKLRAQIAVKDAALEPFVRYHKKRMEVTDHPLTSITSNGGSLIEADWRAAARALEQREQMEPRIESYILIPHRDCIGIICGPVSRMRCNECGAIVDSMNGTVPAPVLVLPAPPEEDPAR